MHAVLVVAALWLLFGGTHVGLATSRIRAALNARLGARGLVWFYSSVASVLFAALVMAYAALQSRGPAGLGLALAPAVRAALGAAIGAGVVLMVGAFAPSGYWESPVAVLQDGVRPPWGLERVTRHPFFAGLVLVMSAHALLATRATGTVFFAGFVALAVGGAAHQGRKLRARHGEPYARYLASTSAVPFVAVARGRQRLVLAEIPWVTLALGVPIALGLRYVHGGLLAWGGAPLIASVVGGSAVIGFITTTREARARAAAAQRTA